MSLPEEYRTARFKSLPQGLMAEAEAIIKKKFGIKEEKNSPKAAGVAKHIEEMITHVNGKFIQEYTPVDINNFYIEPTHRPMLVLRDVQYNPRDGLYRVRVDCHSCGVTQTNTCHRGDVEILGYERIYTCRCGQDRYHVSEREFHRAYSKDAGNLNRPVYMPADMLW